LTLFFRLYIITPCRYVSPLFVAQAYRQQYFEQKGSYMKNRKSEIALRAVAIMLTLALTLALAACGSQSSSSDSASASAASAVSAASSVPSEPTVPAVTLQIFAANSLQKALPEVQELYRAENPEITFAETQFLASGELVTKLKTEPSAADLLITASKGTMDDASNNGSIDAATRRDLFDNDLVIVTKVGSGITLSSLTDVTNPQIAKIAIGESSAVPAGAYANQTLNSIGLYSSDTGKDGAYDAAIVDKVVQESSVGNVCKTVANGDAQIGFVYSSDVYRFEGIEVILTVPSNSHKAIIYPGAVVKASANAQAAQAFMDFCISSPEALAIFSKYGFEVL
jgi:molybdate transport system substrate-binding protein